MFVSFILLFLVSTPSMAGFLRFPLDCSTPLSGGVCPSTSINYTVQKAYTANSINSVLDHSMKLNTNNYYPYGKYSNSGGNKIITAFNGESVSGATSGDETCVGGTIYIHPDYNPSLRMTNNSGCGSGYSSYDEHPGYDYSATTGTKVFAAASGYVLSGGCYLGNNGYTCAGWGAVGILHSNGYITQYFHMDTVLVSGGSWVNQGDQIGTVGNKCPPCAAAGITMGAHLHFEVRKNSPTIGAETYPIVDPYGWVGYGSDPLYSAPYVTPANLWQ